MHEEISRVMLDTLFSIDKDLIASFTQRFEPPVDEPPLAVCPGAHWIRMKRRDEDLLDGRTWPQSSERDDWQLAYHGTSPESAFLIADQGLQVGSGFSAGKMGVYFHRASRLSSCNHYVVWSKLNPSYPAVFGAVIECLVNRNAPDARSVHGQWWQQTGSIKMTAVHFGILPLAEVPRFKGKMNIAMKDVGARAKEIFDSLTEKKLAAALSK